MSAAYHLRPVSPSPPPPQGAVHSPPPPPSAARPRRPLTPSSLRDVDLSATPDGGGPRKYPAPPTGHDLMAMFPAAPPAGFPEMRPGPTSGFFVRQERAFFAQAGREIVRVRVEVDFPGDEPKGPPNTQRPSGSGSALGMAGNGRPWLSGPPPPQQQHMPPPHPMLPPHPHPHGGPPPPAPPAHHHHPHAHSPAQPASPPLFYPRAGGSPPHAHGPDGGHPPGVGGGGGGGGGEDDDEAWRRPMPYAERRRAGKHTKRVIVRT
ncbi:hypothetical protein HYPSUDRAFT_65226 [Hypholoma sublateritium FD-334 SS-4]|uniref:Uncharacterized protein n=1 Tax=Hypholoma sublateritium (strain FD-334 SS-4) TaxID=945553 RepID=A0A0D2MLY3_HYPSF|nr:hypothetical protein HYPSUDRAFT_65226 [Hypholoma sublateritium FD-334 SS-4]